MPVIAAKVLKIEKHPNADRLRLVWMNRGEPLIEGLGYGPVVCGAFNFSEGDMVALALPGATIKHNIHSAEHESFVLNKATIRGVESQGMICAAFELGLSPDPGHKPEIMVLPSGTKPGTIVDY
jgi:phenylalanyl-tRNA synthetase beta chain